MEVLTRKIQNSYIRLITNFFDRNFSDIVAVKTIYFYLKSILFSFCSYLVLNPNITGDPAKLLEEAVSEMISEKLLSSKIGLFYSSNKQEINNEFCQFTNELQILSNNNLLSLFYEYQLSYELNITTNTISFFPLKTSKDMTGSYYTPKELAFLATRRAIDKYIESNIGIANFSTTDSHSNEQLHTVQQLFLASHIIDFSCGGGEFISAVQEYAKLYLKLEGSSIARNIWAIDVDPIALQITAVNILKDVQPSFQNSILDHFILGNPLIEVSEESTYERKVDLFAINRIYSTDMGLNLTARFMERKFDLILGNPPWEKIRLEEKKFFLPLYPEISQISQKAARCNKIRSLKELNPELHKYYLDIASDYLKIKKLVKRNRFLNYSLIGELNTYTLFAELATNLLSPNGLSVLILKGSIISSPNLSKLFRHFIDLQIIREIYLFSNTNKIFNIDSRERFCVVYFSYSEEKTFEVSVGLSNVYELLSAEKITIDPDILYEINPLTGLMPNITSKDELFFLLDTHKRLPIFKHVFTDCHFGRLVHLTLHSTFIDKVHTNHNIPIYEGKFIDQYDGRFSTFAGVPENRRYANKASAKKIKPSEIKPIPESRYFIHKDFWETISKNYKEPFSLYWRSLTSSTNSRTMIATILPHIPTCQSIQLLQTSNIEHLLLLVALFNSIPFDYFVRLKLSGIDLTQNIINQIPVPPLSAYEKEIEFLGVYDSIKHHIFNRVYALYRNEDRLKALFELSGYSFSIEGFDKPKKELMNELDILVAEAYGIPSDILETIMTKFENNKI